MRDSAQKCYVCDEDLEDDRVIDHSHVSGKVRGIAHSDCNLKLQFSRELPVFFHNFKGYDSHFILKYLELNKNIKVTCISSNKETFKSLTVGKIAFRDTAQILAPGTSVDSLAKNLKSFEILEQDLHLIHGYDPERREEQLSLLKRKGVFPYDYLSKYSILNETATTKRRVFLRTEARRHQR